MNDSIQSSFIDKGIHYKIQLTIQQADTFSILLLDEDQPERWEGLFNGQSINKLTTSAGNTKKVQIFFKMLQNAILGNSKEVSFTILSQRDIDEMKNGSSSQMQSSMSAVSLNEIRYFILEQHTEFDRVKYPLRLICKPYSTDELKGIIRNLRSENKRLATSEQASNQREKVQALEQQIYDLNGSIRRLADEKDQIISSLRRQISDLEEKARIRNANKNQSSNASRSKTFRSNNSRNNNNSNYNFSSGSNTRNTPNARRKTNPSITSVSNRTGLSTTNRYQSNTRNSRFSSASSSGANSRRSSASNSRKSSAAGSRKNSAVGSARSSATNSRPSSRSSNGSFKRFNPTEWVMNHQQSGGGSRNNSRNQSPANAHKPIKRVSSSGRGITPTDAHLKRLHALVQKKYL